MVPKRLLHRDVVCTVATIRAPGFCPRSRDELGLECSMNSKGDGGGGRMTPVHCDF